MASARIWDRLGALSGAAAAAATVAFILLTDPYDEATDPNPTQPSAALARAYVANQGDAQAGSSFGLTGAFLLLWFIGHLRRHLRRAEGEDEWLSSVAYGGGLITVGLLLVGVSVSLAESELATYGDDTQVAKTFLVYSWNFAAVLAPPMGALVAATTVAGFRFNALPRWLAWASALIGLAMLGLAPFGAGQAAIVGLGWLVLVSLTQFVQAARSR